MVMMKEEMQIKNKKSMQRFIEILQKQTGTFQFPLDSDNRELWDEKQRVRVSRQCFVSAVSLKPGLAFLSPCPFHSLCNFISISFHSLPSFTLFFPLPFASPFPFGFSLSLSPSLYHYLYISPLTFSLLQ